MPAAAVIPAPVAYIIVVAVKKLVVGFLARRPWSAVFVLHWAVVCTEADSDVGSRPVGCTLCGRGLFFVRAGHLSGKPGLPFTGPGLFCDPDRLL